MTYTQRKFVRGNWGFMLYADEGGEGEDVAAVFEQMLSAFTFLP